MKRPPLFILVFILVFILLFFGVGGLFRFSENVRSVDVVGLFASGVSFGAALVGIIIALMARIKP